MHSVKTGSCHLHNGSELKGQVCKTYKDSSDYSLAGNYVTPCIKTLEGTCRSYLYGILVRMSRNSLKVWRDAISG